LRSDFATRVGLLPPLAAELPMAVVSAVALAVEALCVVAAGAAAVVAAGVDAHAVPEGLALMLPPRMALPVAVQLLPAVELGGSACATAKPPAVSVTAAIKVVKVVLVFMRFSPDW
jgi:hypothetical protein